jgi:hypothetical protein
MILIITELTPAAFWIALFVPRLVVVFLGCDLSNSTARNSLIFRINSSLPDMEKKQCLNCCQLFNPCPQVPHQSYCSSPSCQRARRSKWMRNKLKTDSDYQDNQLRAQKAWSERNPDYWKKYRESHPEYVERNRISQRQRNTKFQANLIANIDESSAVNPFPSGIYRLSLVSDNTIAKMNVWTVEIRMHSCECVSPFEIANR